MSEVPHLSIVVPSYNEAERIGATLQTLSDWMDAQSFATEVLVVDDGSDDATVDVVWPRSEADERIRLLLNGSNRGKGFSVGHGIEQARGAEILFSDADLSTPIEEYDRLAAALPDADIVIGSRALPDSNLEKRQPLYREMMGRTFNLLVQALVFPGIHDTQCGFKLFRAPVARSLFEGRTIDGFAFDVEILYLARLRGLRVVELPVTWCNDEASRVDPIRHSLRMFRDIARIRRRHRGG